MIMITSTSLRWWKIKNSIFCLLFILVGCTSVETKERKLLAEVVQDITKKDMLPNIRAYILIPNAGCDGCISTAEQFMIDNIKKYSDVQFILTGIGSKKLYKNRFGALLQNPKVLSDYQNLAGANNLHSIYPKIFYMNNGQITKIVEASPEAKTDVWQDLKKYLMHGKEK
ncbi:MAG: hypothetical protein EAZ95_00935 [Bacteroidetes bacterium]|nr:MAG: hypothetical protein EAZ95_00935 [Bacteroidota bacterium]